MTDNEIIKALKYCFTRGFDESTCYECPFYTATAKCTEDLRESVLDLINRQKAEIEGLEETRYELACIIDELLMYIAEGKETKSAKPIEIKCDDFENKSDFVNVVRCKDCKHCEIADNGRFRKKIYCFQPAPIKQIVETEENRFCSYGERKEDEGK